MSVHSNSGHEPGFLSRVFQGKLSNEKKQKYYHEIIACLTFKLKSTKRREEINAISPLNWPIPTSTIKFQVYDDDYYDNRWINEFKKKITKYDVDKKIKWDECMLLLSTFSKEENTDTIKGKIYKAIKETTAKINAEFTRLGSNPPPAYTEDYTDPPEGNPPTRHLTARIYGEGSVPYRPLSDSEVGGGKRKTHKRMRSPKRMRSRSSSKHKRSSTRSSSKRSRSKRSRSKRSSRKLRR